MPDNIENQGNNKGSGHSPAKRHPRLYSCKNLAENVYNSSQKPNRQHRQKRDYIIFPSRLRSGGGFCGFLAHNIVKAYPVKLA